MDKQLLVQMELLRDKMVETAMLKQNLLHRDVITLSQSLDKIIVQVQEERRLLTQAN
ncbi:aspartyl-phosphate phosphatase Spo0E family protein [Paenibacillus arenilitoris]|uniref:Aspartyl-phosphate phosphatase Spo0E family protein n=1 Tax=Paenibacillus arenilitoris TaxID=2772299 RepID=A0A927CPJ1_9BACL|nr:aspartyl-phosphate phosphatase Spo0E family protein [Paenibacillus arenilitoris]MBD2869591.1 aspartyl-phosphate phosphatase Spo0E family protein [Paenibacillus arenilitoris]